MANVKISDMAPASDIHGVDELPMVIGGTNNRVSKTDLLTGGTGEDVALRSSAGQEVDLDTDSGDAKVRVLDDGTVVISASGHVRIEDMNGNTFIETDGAGNVFIQSIGAGTQVFFTADGTVTLALAEATRSIDMAAGGGVNMPIIVANPGDWAGADPLTVYAAIDRIARVVSVGGTVPIP